LIPLRDKKNHMPFPGVLIGDCGAKMGMVNYLKISLK
jgi:hypothetical protein